jgi:hypothetical protein
MQIPERAKEMNGLRLFRSENLELRKHVIALQAALRVIERGQVDDDPAAFATAVLQLWGHEP